MVPDQNPFAPYVYRFQIDSKSLHSSKIKSIIDLLMERSIFTYQRNGLMTPFSSLHLFLEKWNVKHLSLPSLWRLISHHMSIDVNEQPKQCCKLMHRKCFRCTLSNILPYSEINPSILDLICKLNLYNNFVFVSIFFLSLTNICIFVMISDNKTVGKKISSAAAFVSSLNIFNITK